MSRALLALLLLAAPAAALAQAGLTAAPTLRRPLSARAAGLGGAFTGVEGGLASIGHNPAGLTGLKKMELRTTYMHGLVEDKFTFLNFGSPAGPAVLTGGLMYYDGGSIHVNLSNGTREKRKAAQDFVGVLGGAVALGPVSIGAQVKAMRLALGGEATAAGGAADGGALWRTPVKGLTLGASILNAGPDVKFENEGDPLPLTLRAGAAWSFASTRDPTFAFSNFLLTADAFKTRDEDAGASAGLEMEMNLFEQSRLGLRLGYLLREIGSFSFGVGIDDGRFSLDYAMAMAQRLSNAHHLTFGISF